MTSTHLRPTSTALRVLYYALGGGRGHATRSRTLAGWFPVGSEIHFVLPARLAAWSQGLQAHLVEPGQLAQQVEQLLCRLRPDLLVVDTFPRGLLGELAEVDFACPAWLVARWLKPAYAARTDVMAALERYEKILCVELTPWERGLEIGPVVSPPASPAGPVEPLWLGSGPLPEQQELHNFLLGRATLVAPQLGLARDDVGQLLAAAPLVISAGGYNAYHEIVQAGTPVIFWPQERLYDDQAVRVAGHLGPRPRGWVRCVRDREGLEAAWREWEGCRPERAAPLALACPERVRQLFT